MKLLTKTVGLRTHAIDTKRDSLFAVNGLCTFFLAILTEN